MAFNKGVMMREFDYGGSWKRIEDMIAEDQEEKLNDAEGYLSKMGGKPGGRKSEPNKSPQFYEVSPLKSRLMA
ncbi:MAG: hypothetical protein ACE5FU_11835 [Nitrospinota bacterium]